MKTVKRMICVLAVLAMIFSMAGCGEKKTEAPETAFTDLKLGISLEEAESVLGSDYTMAGTTPDRAIYENIRLFDFLGKDDSTKLSVFLNTENKAYAYAYYIYDAVDGNYAKLKEYLTGLYGEPVEGENESEQWVNGDITYSVNNQGEYVAIGAF